MCAVKINAELIEEAERILLPQGCHFDDERRKFITDLSSRDLLAVPGSGKTTALQAKLYCLSKSLPFDSGSGVLVLSHTNAAVDEVKRKLAHSAPQLFTYPNAVVTVQEFIDRFLALPFYANSYRLPVAAIDGARYIEAIDRYMRRIKDFVRSYWAQSRPDSNPFYRARFYYDSSRNRTVLSGSVPYSELNVPIPQNWAKTAEEKKTRIKEVIRDMKYSIMKEGILSYDDCYFLASVYLAKFPQIKTILKNRFSFVFVDETQDLKQFQLDILSRIFDDAGVIVQRIGDCNQAIFSSGNEGDCEWGPKNQMMLKNSLRLNQAIADVVNPFMLNRRTNEDKEELFVNGVQPNPSNIKPVLVLYDPMAPESLKSSFMNLICYYGLAKHPDAKYGFHIIGWNASYSNAPSSADVEKPRLEDIFPEYRHKSVNRMNMRVTLSNYLNMIDDSYSSKEIKDDVLSAICRAASLAGAKLRIITARGEGQRHYSPSSYMAKAKEDEDTGRVLDLVLYQVAHNLRKGNKSQAYEILKQYITGPLLELLDVTSNEPLQRFLGEGYQDADNGEKNEDEEKNCVVNDSEVPIMISTVHSAKGQTHCATMYVETSFRNKFESEWLITTKKATKTLPERLLPSPFFGDLIIPETDGARKAMKMLYVGFSRPRQLLCYASWKALWTKERLSKMQERGWIIIDTTQEEVAVNLCD